MTCLIRRGLIGCINESGVKTENYMKDEDEGRIESEIEQIVKILQYTNELAFLIENFSNERLRRKFLYKIVKIIIGKESLKEFYDNEEYM